jgi:hypothetical protein
MAPDAKFEGNKMKLLGAVAVCLGVIGLCAAPYPAHAAGKYDGSAPFVCVPTAVAECTADGECRPGTAESENLPDFFKVDLKARIIRAEDEGRQSRIKEIERSDGLLSLSGSGVRRSWILIIREKTGKMSASITGDGLSFVIFGVCPAP